MPNETDPGNPGQGYRSLDEVLIAAQQAKIAGNLIRAGQLFGRCVKAFEPRLIGSAFLWYGDWHLAEDAYQEACLKIFSELEMLDLRSCTAFSRFYTVFSSKLTDNYRKRNRKSLRFTSWRDISGHGDDDTEFDPDDPRYSTEALRRAEYLVALETFVATLSTFDRTLLSYRRRGLSFKAIRKEMPTEWPVKVLSKHTQQLIKRYHRFLDDVHNR